MRRSGPLAALAALFLFALSGIAAAEEAVIEVEGLQVVGNLTQAKGKALKGDTVALLLHDTLASNQADSIVELQDGLAQAGVSSLAITLSLGLNERRGAFDCSLEQDHRGGDADSELAAWVDWLKAKGVAGVVLVGEGRGGAQVAAFARKADKIVKKVAVISPLAETAESAAASFEQQYGQPLGEFLAQALALVDQDEASTLMDVPGFLSCPKARVTAGAFADYYRPSPEHSAPGLLGQLALPKLAIVVEGSQNAADVQAGVAGLPTRSAVTVDAVPAGPPDVVAGAAAKRIATFVTGR
jgi:hypothetical protein